MRRNEQAEGFLLRSQQLGPLELDARDRGVAWRGRPHGATAQVEDRALAGQRVLLGLLACALGLLEHLKHPLAGRTGRAERPALDQCLDRFLVDRTTVDARAEVVDAR